MPYSFNLVDEKWIPCVAFDGSVEELSLRDALVQAHLYRELGGESPLVTVALYRLLLAVLHRVFGPKDRDAWRELWLSKRWDSAALDAYLTRWQHRFDLFDEQRPFFQADHPTILPNPIGNLLHELCKNDTFYDHRTLDGVELNPAEATRHLLTAQAFGRWMTKGPYGQLPFGDKDHPPGA
ncbi:MAG: type I-E CRISPR-associated protein Cse1/CasA, partial [Chloroflexi bacterium]|nr:type I-E CRISPR-associated protein Cse1/CasA [Chloroflexota bacterium]